MNIPDAAYAVAHDYPGGTESLAPRLGMSGAMLRNKVNINNTTHHLTLAEAVRMTDLTDNDQILQAWARARGKVLIDMPAPENCADSDVIELISRSLETHGAVGKEIVRTLEDGRVEQHEAAKVRDRVWSHIVTVVSLASRIEGMAEK